MQVGLMISGLGLLCFIWYLVMVLSPAKALRLMKGFSRNKLAGAVISTITVVWAAILLFAMPLGWFDGYKQSLYILAPLTLILVVKFMDELLAPRALGALLLLIPAPILSGVRFHESPLRLVVVVVCYLMAIKGIMLVLSPYKFRNAVDRFMKTEKACRLAGSIGVLLAVFLLVTGLLVFGGMDLV